MGITVGLTHNMALCCTGCGRWDRCTVLAKVSTALEGPRGTQESPGTQGPVPT